MRQASRAGFRDWSQEGWFSEGAGVETEAGLLCVGEGKDFKRGECRMGCELVSWKELEQGADSKCLLRHQYMTPTK